MAEELLPHDGFNTLDDLCLTHVASCVDFLQDLLRLGSTCRRLRAVVASADAAWQRRIYLDFGLRVQGTLLKRQYDALRCIARGEEPQQQSPATLGNTRAACSNGADSSAGMPSAVAEPCGSSQAGPSSAVSATGPSITSAASAPAPLRPFLPFVGTSTDGGCDEPAGSYWVSHMFTPSLRCFYSSEACTKNIHCLAVLQPGGANGQSNTLRAFLVSHLKLPVAYLRRDVLRSVLADQAWESPLGHTSADPLPPLPPDVVEEAQRHLSSLPTQVLEDLFVHCHREMLEGNPWGLLLIRGFHPELEASLRRQWALKQRLISQRAAFEQPESAAAAAAAAEGPGWHLRLTMEAQDLGAVRETNMRRLQAYAGRLQQYLTAAEQAAATGGEPAVPRPKDEERAVAAVHIAAVQIWDTQNGVPYAIRRADAERQPRLLFAEAPLRPLLSGPELGGQRAEAAPGTRTEMATGQRRQDEGPALWRTVGLFDTILVGRTPQQVTCPLRCGALIAAVASAGGGRGTGSATGGAAAGGAAALAASLNGGLASMACVKALSDATTAACVLAASRSGSLPPIAAYSTNGWLEWIEFARPPGAGAQGASGAPSAEPPHPGRKCQSVQAQGTAPRYEAEQPGPSCGGGACAAHGVGAGGAALVPPPLSLPEHGLSVRVLPVVWFRFYSRQERKEMRRSWEAREKRRRAAQHDAAAGDASASAGCGAAAQRQPPLGQEPARPSRPQPQQPQQPQAAAATAAAAAAPGEQRAVQGLAAAMAAAMAAATAGAAGSGGVVAAQGSDGTLRITVGGQQVFEAPLGVDSTASAAAAAAASASAAGAGGSGGAARPGADGGGGSGSGGCAASGAAARPDLPLRPDEGADADVRAGEGASGRAGDSRGSPYAGGVGGEPSDEGGQMGHAFQGEEEEDGFADELDQLPFGGDSDDDGEEEEEEEEHDGVAMPLDEMGDDAEAPLPFEFMDAFGDFGLAPEAFRNIAQQGRAAAAAKAAAAAAAVTNAAMAEAAGKGSQAARSQAGQGEPGTPPLAVQAVPVPVAPVFPLSPYVTDVAPGVSYPYGWVPPGSSGGCVFQLRLTQPWCANLLLAKLIDCEDLKPAFNRQRGGCNIDAGNIAVQGPAPLAGRGGCGPVVRLMEGVELA